LDTHFAAEIFQTRRRFSDNFPTAKNLDWVIVPCHDANQPMPVSTAAEKPHTIEQ